MVTIKMQKNDFKEMVCVCKGKDTGCDACETSGFLIYVPRKIANKRFFLAGKAWGRKQVLKELKK